MDYYRLRCPPYSGCKSIEYTPQLLDCAYPPLEDSSTELFKEAKKREEFLFFSQEKLRDQFKTKAVIEDILNCSCDGCRKQGPESGVDKEFARRAIVDQNNEQWLILAMLIYLGKLHIFHYWVAGSPNNLWSLPKALLDDPKPDPLFKSLTERRLFRAAYNRTEHMFRPQKLMMSEDWLQPFLKLEDPDIRFPFIDDRTHSFSRGNFGTMTKFSVPPEYVDKSVRSRLVGYPSSNDGVREEYHFVRKVLKGSISDELNINMEKDLLRMLASIEGAVSNNIITLLVSYQWRNRIHFIFPFVAGDLYRVLNKGWRPDRLPMDESGMLPEFWLWKELINVCKALKAIHTEIPNIFQTSGKAKVAAFHFDLKPANILVTRDGTLKITDFGQSLIQLVEDKDEISGTYLGGDLVYCAPEGRPSRDEFGSVSASASDDTSDDMKVLLNYDIWAVACIMTEVLTYFFGGSGSSGSDAVRCFREERKAEGTLEDIGNPAAFFTSRRSAEGTQATLKECVRNKLDAFRKAPSDFASQQYIKETVDLILNMFEIQNKLRPFSVKVVEDLNTALSAYRIARNHPMDDLYQHVQRILVDQEARGWNRVGWQEPGEGTVHAFVEMGEVFFKSYFSTVNPRHPNMIETETEFPRSPCRFHLYHKEQWPTANAEFYLSLGFNQAGVGIRSLEQMIEASNWFLAPIYMDDESTNPDGAKVYKVALIKPMEQTQNKSQVIVLEFKSLSNAQALQSALLQHQVPTIHKAEQVITTKPNRKVVGMINAVAVQIWSAAKPLYTSQGRRGSNRPVRVNTWASSTPSNATPKCCIVIFDRKTPFLVVPIDTRNKRLNPDTTARFRAKLSPENRGRNHNSFPVLNQKPGIPRWDATWGVRTIPLDQYQFERYNGTPFPWEVECRNIVFDFNDTGSREEFMENVWNWGAVS